LIHDGLLIAAAEEERFVRIKHVAGFPTQSVQFCMAYAGIKPEDLDVVAISRNPWAHWLRKIPYALRATRSHSALKDRWSVWQKTLAIRHAVAQALGISPKRLRASVVWVEHHRAHMASSFYPSGWEKAAVLSLDGFGDFTSGMWAVGDGPKLKIQGAVHFPHSLGILYTAITQFLGFQSWGDEYKVMGLAAYGRPERYLNAMEHLAWATERQPYRLGLPYFRHHRLNVSMTWDHGPPHLAPLFEAKIEALLGPPRLANQPLEERHADIAASLQRHLERLVLPFMEKLHRKTGLKRLCYAGGVALNCALNGKIRSHTGFEEVFVQPAAHDAGTALGAALYVAHHRMGLPRSFQMRHAGWGPKADEGSCRQALEQAGLSYRRYEPDALCKMAAHALRDGQLVGWFQGRMEFGPRALGHRSLLADPRDPKMKAWINERVKRREPFRPFAPAVLQKRVPELFPSGHPDPFMLFAYPVRSDWTEKIPAVIHADGTGRLQAVDPNTEPLFANLLAQFEACSGVPVLLNTSFNENEPIVCRPEEAVSCFLRNGIDALALGPFWAVRRN